MSIWDAEKARTNPPFPSSKGAPWASPSGDPRAAVVGAARREELIQKSKVNANREKLAKSKSNPKFLKAKGFKPLPGIANFPPKFRG